MASQAGNRAPKGLLAFGLCIFGMILCAAQAFGYRANKVWFEFRPSGLYRVHVNYTVPELKEFRESVVEFRSKEKAERFYFDLIRGADFYPPDPKARRFQGNPRKPRPW